MITDLFDCKTPYLAKVFESCVYPWDIVGKISETVETLLLLPPKGFEFFADGILIGKNVEISTTATVLPPAIIGDGTVIGPGAYLRGNVIVGKNCVIGNSTELKNCLLLDGVRAPHYNYIGDSVVGSGSHLGAAAICSNLKSDGSRVFVRGEKSYDTGRRKFGSAIGDGAEIGCGCVLNPGSIIGKNATVYPLLSVRGVVKENMILKAPDNAVLKRF